MIVEHRGSYVVLTDTGPVEASVTNQLRRAAQRADALFPAVGDWVWMTSERADGGRASRDRASITGTQPRRSVLMRSGRALRGSDAAPRVLAANVDVVGVVTTAERAVRGADAPGGDRLERLLVAAAVGGSSGVVVVNKADLVEPDLDALAHRFDGTQVLVTSALTGRGVDALEALCADDLTLCLVGASGVGKSSLVNALLGAASGEAATAEVAPLSADGRGRHTTTRRTLHLLARGQAASTGAPSDPTSSRNAGGAVVDTPGLEYVVPCAASADPRRAAAEIEAGLATVFADVVDVAATCRFASCAHDTEPDCAVSAAVEHGTLSPLRVAALARLSAELFDD